jgi:hypothetical protein
LGFAVSSAVENYVATKQTRDAIEAEVKAIAASLNGIVKILTLDPRDLIKPVIRYPVEDDDRPRTRDDDPEYSPQLTGMPTAKQIGELLIKLRNAEIELTNAYESLSEIEKNFVEGRKSSRK